MKVCINCNHRQLHTMKSGGRNGRRSGWESLGDPCDVRTWETFESWLKERTGDA